MDCSPPISSAPGILQARILEWVAISFSTVFKIEYPYIVGSIELKDLFLLELKDLEYDFINYQHHISS